MAAEDKQLRLLVVDDEPKLTEFLRMELEVEGYSVDTVSYTHLTLPTKVEV